MCSAGEGDADGEHELAGFRAVCLGDGGDGFLGGVRRPIGQRGHVLRERGEEGGVRIAFGFRDRLLILRSGVRNEEIDGVRDFGEQPDFFFHGGDHGGVVFRDRQLLRFDERFCQIREGFRGDFRDVLLVHPFAFLEIEAGGRAVDRLQREAVDEFGEGENLLIGFR